MTSVTVTPPFPPISRAAMMPTDPPLLLLREGARRDSFGEVEVGEIKCHLSSLQSCTTAEACLGFGAMAALYLSRSIWRGRIFDEVHDLTHRDGLGCN